MTQTKNTNSTPTATFTKFPLTENWVEGTCGIYKFQAKLYDGGSDYGINDGRVSKLWIREAGNIHAKPIVTYDRGWENKPATAEHRAVYEAVMNLLENSPKRFN